MTTTHYETLDVPTDASATQVRVAYCTAIWPAWFRGDEEREEALRTARAVLCTKRLREAYNEQIGLTPRKIEWETSPATDPPVASAASRVDEEPAIRLPKPQGPAPSPESIWPPEGPPRRLLPRVLAAIIVLCIIAAAVWFFVR